MWILIIFQVFQSYFSENLNFQIQEFNFKLAYFLVYLTKLRDLRCCRNFFEWATNMSLIAVIKFGLIMGENWARKKNIIEMTRFCKMSISRTIQLQMVWFLHSGKLREKYTTFVQITKSKGNCNRLKNLLQVSGRDKIWKIHVMEPKFQLLKFDTFWSSSLPINRD